MNAARVPQVALSRTKDHSPFPLGTAQPLHRRLEQENRMQPAGGPRGNEGA